MTMNNLNHLEEMIFANVYSLKYFDLAYYDETKAAKIARDFAISAVIEFRKLALKSANEDLEQYHVEG